MLDRIEAVLAMAPGFVEEKGRPLVTLTYAQSLDGSIATRKRQPLLLSGQESLTMTHQLRAWHAGIVVGIGTVLSDDPRLTVRLVKGPNPRPIVLDSKLRCPPDARLLKDRGVQPIIATTNDASKKRHEKLIEAGADIWRLSAEKTGRVKLKSLMRRLAKKGINSIMVEGGAEVITAFLQAELVDQVIVTIAPQFVAGLPAIDKLPSSGVALRDVDHNRLGDDLVVWGKPVWSS